MQDLIAIATLSILCYTLILCFIPIARKIDLVDRPNQRKKHLGEIPLIGGLAIYTSILICSILFLELTVPLLSILALGGLLAAIGAFDDRFGLNAQLRLCLQFITGCILAAGSGIALQQLGNLFGFGNLSLGFFSIILTAIGVSGLANAYNMMDGIDGLAASVAIIALGALLLSIYPQASRTDILLLCFYIISLMIYLLFNLQVPLLAHCKVFMGDAGSMFIGFSIAVFMVYYSQPELSYIKPVTALWFVAIPLMDMFSTMLRRILKQQNPFKADRSHLHHLFISAGFSSAQALLIIIAMAALLAAFGWLLQQQQIADFISFGLYLLIFSGYFFCIKHAWKLHKTIKKYIRVWRYSSNKNL